MRKFRTQLRRDYMFVLVGVICFTAEVVGSEKLTSLGRDVVFFRIRR